MKRRAFLRWAALTAASTTVPPVWITAAESGPVRSSAPEILEQARERIPLIRQGPGTVVVRGADGQPVAGATIKVEQLNHEFLFGCNFFRFGRIPNPEREDLYRRRFAEVMNYATLGFYWPMYEPERGHPQYEYTERVTQWCQEHGITCKGHPLVWDFADPRWLPRDFDEIRQLSEARVREIVTRFKGRIDRWDVVNEPTHLGRFKTRLGEWALATGAVPYVADHLKLARAANPQAVLLVNDYRTDPPFYQILDRLRVDGRLLFDVIGLQSHMHGGGWPLRQIGEVCDRFARLGVPLHFTETTVVSGPRAEGQQWGPSTPDGEAKQADYVPQFYTVLFGHPAVEAITWWDFSDDGAWQGAAAGWVRKDMSPKPVYERLQELIKGQWWTRTEGRTSESGAFSVQAFFGNYRFTVESPDGRRRTTEAQWKRGQVNRIEISLA